HSHWLEPRWHSSRANRNQHKRTSAPRKKRTRRNPARTQQSLRSDQRIKPEQQSNAACPMSVARRIRVARQMSMALQMRLIRKRPEKLIPVTKLRTRKIMLQIRKIMLQINRLVERRMNRAEKVERLVLTMNPQIL